MAGVLKPQLLWGDELGIWKPFITVSGHWQPGWEEPSFWITLFVTRASLCGSPVRLLDLYSVHKPWGEGESVRSPASQ